MVQLQKVCEIDKLVIVLVIDARGLIHDLAMTQHPKMVLIYI